MSTLDAFFTWGGMLLESMAMMNVGREIEQITGKWNNCMPKVLERRILSNDKFCYLEMLAIFKCFALINLLFSYEQLFSPQPTFLECIHIFLLSDRPDCLGGPRYSIPQ